MEKNKQVLEFISIIKDIDKFYIDYELAMNMFFEYLEFIEMSWDEYTSIKTKVEIINDYKYFSLHLYLPF